MTIVLYGIILYKKEVDILIEQTNGGFLISKIKQIQGRIFEKILIEYGIHQFNGAQGRILFVLWEHDNIPITELSHKTGLAKTTLTSMLDRLEGSGHIQRVYNPDDRRTVRIQLTETAKGLKDQYNQASEKMNEIFYEGFSNEEILAFDKSLEKVLNNLTRQEHYK